jgi:aminopeptidase N
MSPKAILLKDYKPSAYLIESIALTVDIFESETVVTSSMDVRKSADGVLELNGENLALLEVRINGEILPNDQFQLSSEKLVITGALPPEFKLEIKNKIDPATNKALEGFYQSGPQLCTQCEPEGFRKITYFIDRPDVMASYRTKMIADKNKYPYLLSNGNKIGSGDLPSGRHWVEWEDPFKKPSYLFAMVAGDFDLAQDEFITKSNRRIALELFVDKGNLHKTSHALESLKQAMKWDEEIFGLEYDLDIYMIVAVDSFNMGAMENKGLNIFNSTYTLADMKSATDHDFQNIQGVIGHEYFHNWTGNRITCRDWFQLTLKEGLTVYRDQEFSSDMLSRAVKRLEDVRLLKDSQFAEDAGPMSHPIRPTSYIEINNFYTRTIYEKGSEVIRMIATLLGKENFRKGMDKYFELFDGQAVTTEDFVKAMELASGKDLSQFKNWYSRPGTPTLEVTSQQVGDQFTLNIEQKYPPTTLKVPEGNILHMPFTVGLVTEDGQSEHTLELKKLKESFSFEAKGRVIPSLNRGFSAPVIVNYPYEFSDLLTLVAQDKDSYCRYEATQLVYQEIFKREFTHYKSMGSLSSELEKNVKDAISNFLEDSTIDLSFKSYLLDLPSESGLAQEMENPDFESIHKVLKHLKRKLGLAFQDWFLAEHQKLSAVKDFDLTPKSFGMRTMKNQALSFLVASGTPASLESLARHYEEATNMTEELQGLIQYVLLGEKIEEGPIKKFYEKWKKDSLVMLKWFSAISAYSPEKVILPRMSQLENDPLFLREVPNYLRALYLQFAKNNLVGFHQASGEGYDLMADRILKVDKFNPQVASRMSSSFSLVSKVDSIRRIKMKAALERVMSGNPSKDTFEVISKYLS